MLIVYHLLVNIYRDRLSIKTWKSLSGMTSVQITL